MDRRSEIQRFYDIMENLDNCDQPSSSSDDDEISIGGGVQSLQLSPEIEAQLKALTNDTEWPEELQGPFAFSPEDCTPSEIIPNEPKYASRYDKLFSTRVALEKKIAAADPAKPHMLHIYIRLLENVEAKISVELERSTDDDWRKLYAIDEWRRGEGRDEYNASRRKVRPEPNVMTPKDVLAIETPEERQARVRAIKAASERRRRAKWTDEDRAKEAFRKRNARAKPPAATEQAQDTGGTSGQFSEIQKGETGAE